MRRNAPLFPAGVARVLVCIAGLAIASGAVAFSQTFSTGLTGLDGKKIYETPVGTPGTPTLQFQSVQDIDESAVCNDGSPYGYYYVPGSGSGSTLWLVYMEGSMFCWDSKSCTMRYQTVPYYMSSANWAPQMSQPGIFSTVESESSFWNVNKVYMKYCSSDLWMGDVAASNATFGYAFRGRRIVHAVITSLIQDRGMVAGHRMLYGGCSAGAIGAMINMDQVAGLAGSYGVQVRGLLDAAALVDVYSTGWAWSPSLVPLQTLVSQLVENLQPPLPSTCASRGYFGKAAWKCFFPAFRMPLLETLFHANVVQFDDFLIQYNTDNLGPATPTQYAFVNSIQSAYLQLIASLPEGTGVFSPTCLVHCLSGQNSFSNLLVSPAPAAPGVSFNDVLTSWYFGTTGLISAISPCSGYTQCTPACGVDYAGAPCNVNNQQQCYPVSLPTEWTASDANQRPPAPESEDVELPSEYDSDNVLLPPGSDGSLENFGSVAATESHLSSEQQAALGDVVAQTAPAAVPVPEAAQPDDLTNGSSDSESSDDIQAPPAVLMPSVVQPYTSTDLA